MPEPFLRSFFQTTLSCLFRNANWNDKGEITDWFSIDFTLEELKQFRKIQVSDSIGVRFEFYGQSGIKNSTKLVNYRISI